ncbi:MAG: hypothetical protein OEW39_16550 [Deltaproteobacteria bacterium]|nr:hypothetical protein [Deltaproteobacteria bacterium]
MKAVYSTPGIPKGLGWLRITRRAAYLLAWMLGCWLWIVPAQAQQPAGGPAPAAAPAGITGGDLGPIPVRLVFTILDQYSYKVHPFYQITGDPGYQPGKAGGASSLFISAHNTTQDETPVVRLFHNIPPFALEGVRALEVPFPKGLGFTFDYTSFSQEDVNAGNEGSAVVPLAMDTYYYMPGIKFFAFDPTAPGLNYFIGIAVGRLEGKVLYPSFYDSAQTLNPSETISFGKSAVGIQRMGLETKGDNFAFRYELMFVRAREIHLSKAYPLQTNTTMNLSGTIVRISFFYEFN